MKTAFDPPAYQKSDRDLFENAHEIIHLSLAVFLKRKATSVRRPVTNAENIKFVLGKAHTAKQLQVPEFA